MFQFYSNCCIRNVDIQCLVYAIQSTNEVAVRLQAVLHEKQYITHTSRRDFASTLWVGEVFKLAGEFPCTDEVSWQPGTAEHIIQFNACLPCWPMYVIYMVRTRFVQAAGLHNQHTEQKYK